MLGRKQFPPQAYCMAVFRRCTERYRANRSSKAKHGRVSRPGGAPRKMASTLNNTRGNTCGRQAIRRRKTRSCDTSSNAALKLTSLTDIIRDYVVNFQPEHEQEMMWFRNQASFEEALNLAAQAQDDMGRRYSHQRRIKLQSIANATRALADAHDDLRNCPSFHELWNLIGSCLDKVKGVRELYVYDCASRLGAYLGLQPQKVYLHAGTREGAKNLGLLSQKDARPQWLEPTELSPALRSLPPTDVENLLCIYKSELARLK